MGPKVVKNDVFQNCPWPVPSPLLKQVIQGYFEPYLTHVCKFPKTLEMGNFHDWQCVGEEVRGECVVFEHPCVHHHVGQDCGDT